MRQTPTPTVQPSPLEVSITISGVPHTLRIENKEIVRLGEKEIILRHTWNDILRALIGAEGKALSRTELKTACGSRGADETNVIDVYISHIRRELRILHPKADRLVETVRNRGYYFKREI